MSDERSSGTGTTAPGESNMNPGDEAAPGAPGTGENICPECSGKGQLASGGKCPNCNGTGKVITGIAGG
jgi:RecJ-like exonuclease